MLTRKYQGVRAVTAFNNSTRRKRSPWTCRVGYGDKPYQDAVTGRSVRPSNGKITLTVPALSGSVLITK